MPVAERHRLFVLAAFTALSTLALVSGPFAAAETPKVGAAPSSGARPAHELAVYSEYSDSDKPMKSEANARVFNRVEVQSGDSIRLDLKTGVVTLRPGTYHITATSILTPYDPKIDVDGRVSPQSRPWGAYARLRYLDKPKREDTPIAIGTMSDVNMIPSTIDTFLTVKDKDAELVLDHQAGADVTGLYLQVRVGDSSWHVFARISIERL
jgi:hypothetical protein